MTFYVDFLYLWLKSFLLSLDFIIIEELPWWIYWEKPLDFIIPLLFASLVVILSYTLGPTDGWSIFTFITCYLFILGGRGGIKAFYVILLFDEFTAFTFWYLFGYLLLYFGKSEGTLFLYPTKEGVFY